MHQKMKTLVNRQTIRCHQDYFGDHIRKFFQQDKREIGTNRISQQGNPLPAKNIEPFLQVTLHYLAGHALYDVFFGPVFVQFTIAVKEMVETINVVFGHDGIFEHMELPARHAITVEGQHGLRAAAVFVVVDFAKGGDSEVAHVGNIKEFQ